MTKLCEIDFASCAGPTRAEQSVLFAKVVPNVALAVKPLLEAPYDLALPCLQVSRCGSSISTVVKIVRNLKQEM